MYLRQSWIYVLNLHKDIHVHYFKLYFICLICLNVHVGIIILIKPREEMKGKINRVSIRHSVLM